MIIKRYPSGSSLETKGESKRKSEDEARDRATSPNMVTNMQKRELMVAMSNKLSDRSLVQKETCWTDFVLKNEDNIRFILLAVVILIYMVIGAAIFLAFEGGNEIREKNLFRVSFASKLDELKQNIQSRSITIEEVENLLYMWGNASANKLIPYARQWDYAGSFYFVYTVVSTTGFGAATPKTMGGKMFVIIYGLLGCSCGILFFNLFLDRIITVIALVMKANFERQNRHRIKEADSDNAQTSTDDLNSWKPSVYWVTLYLGLFSIVIGVLASIMFMYVESWSYLNSIYFCFVTFATIGFGDYVSVDKDPSYYGHGLHAYQFGNFFVMVMGCCCIYSLFNVISIIIKQFLNCMIKWMVVCSNVQDYIPKVQMNGVSSSPVENTSNKDLAGFEQSEAERKLSGQIFTLQDYVSAKRATNEFMKTINKKREEGAEVRVDTPSPKSRKFSATSRMLSATSRKFSTEDFMPGQVGSLAIAASKLSEN